MVEVDELFEKERAILARLEMLSEAPTQQALDEKMSLHRTHPAGSPPPGVRLSKKDGPPSKDVSLYAFHEWHISRARIRRNSVERVRAVAFAEIDYEIAKYRKPLYEVKRETGAEIRLRIATTYPGEHAVVVAAREGISERAVQNWRKSFGFDPVYGERMAA